MYKTLRFYYRFTSAIFAKYWIAIIIGSVLGTAFFLSVPEFLKLLPRTKTSKHVAVVGKFTPSDLPANIQKQISYGLTVIGTNGLPSPGLAKSWTVSANGQEYLFELDTDRVWHDGQRLKSRDLVFNFKDVKIDYPSDSQIKFTLEQPFAPFLSILSRPVLKTNQSKIIGLGTYKVRRIEKNGSLVQTLHLTSSSREADAIPDIFYHIYSSVSQAQTAFKLGLASSVVDLSDTAGLESWPGVTAVSNTQMDRYVAIVFNTEQMGKNTRLGLAYATDKTVWQDHRAVGPLSPLSWSFNPELKTFDQDLTRARDILKREGKLPEKLTIVTLPSLLKTAETVAQSWRQLSLPVDIQVAPDIPEDFSILITTLPTSPDPDQYNLWHSTQIQTNLSRLKNPRIDKLLEDGRKELDLEKRRTIYQEFQKYLVEEVPAIFLYYPQTVSLSR